jgi:hypothetical protein
MRVVTEHAPSYGIEFNEKIESFKCSHCREESKTVWGRVSNNGAAHAVYFLGLLWIAAKRQ